MVVLFLVVTLLQGSTVLHDVECLHGAWSRVQFSYNYVLRRLIRSVFFSDSFSLPLLTNAARLSVYV